VNARQQHHLLNTSPESGNRFQDSCLKTLIFNYGDKIVENLAKRCQNMQVVRIFLLMYFHRIAK